MCDTCGCGEEKFTVHKPGEPGHSHGDEHHSHSHDHDHSHGHQHDLTHVHVHPAGPVKDGRPGKVIDLNLDIMSHNNLLAQRNRGYFEGRDVLCLNMVSSPGSGKTTILEKTIHALKASQPIFVIEGDQQTTNDADRIKNSGAPAVQVNTGTGCHLDANMIKAALNQLEVSSGSVLFIENVGNLVCPALFDLGEQKRVVVISVTEGEDKPLKYPYMFQSSDLCIINKTDLLPYVDFDVEKASSYARQLNPKLEIILLSARSGEGMQQWFNWIARQKETGKN